nr:MAG TPA: hypothetical protein [Caudoviricetes sp.]
MILLWKLWLEETLPELISHITDFTEILII